MYFYLIVHVNVTWVIHRRLRDIQTSTASTTSRTDGRHSNTHLTGNHTSLTEIPVAMVAPPGVNSANYSLRGALIRWDQRSTTHHQQWMWPLWWHHQDAFPQTNN